MKSKSIPTANNSVPGKKLTIGHIIYAFNDGGMERGIVNLINHGDQQQFRHVIICLTEAGSFSKLLRSPDCSLIELHKRSGNDWRLPWVIARVARQHGIDILHARGWPTLLETAIGARFAGIPATVYAFHGRTMDELGANDIRRQLVQSIFIRSYQRVITLNSQMQLELARESYLSLAMIQIIANGVDVDHFSPRKDRTTLRSKFGLPNDRFILGSIARLDRVKNHDVILKAFHRIKNSGFKAFLLIVGEGPARAVIQNTISMLGLNADVLLFGFSNCVSELLNCMDAYIQSSFYEGFSNTVLEAMACALPVLATKVGGTVDVISDKREGFFFEPADDRGLASLTIQLINNPVLRRDLGKRGRIRAVDCFPVEKMVNSYQNLYRDLMTRAR